MKKLNENIELVKIEIGKIKSIGECPIDNVKITSDLGIRVMANIITDILKLNKMNKGKLIDADELKRRISLTRLLNTENKIHIKDIIDELSEDREEYQFTIEDIVEFVEWTNLHYRKLEYTKSIKNVKHTKELFNLWITESQPNPLKVAIKGDGTEEYGKKIIEYFTSFGCTNNKNFACNGNLYYFINEENNLWWEFNLPEGYTEISLKGEKKSLIDNHITQHIENSIGINVLGENVQLKEDNQTLSKELEEVISDRDDLAKKFIEFKDRENVILEASIKEVENRKKVLISKILDFNNQYKNSISTIQDFKNGVHGACTQIIDLVEKM